MDFQREILADLPLISSRSNQYLKQIRILQQKKAREEKQLFLVEGLRLAEEAVSSSGELVYGLLSQDFLANSRGQKLANQALAKKIPLFLVEEEMLKQVCPTENSQGIVFVASYLLGDKLSFQQKIKDNLLIADKISDPGNLGTLLRTALAAGSQGILLLPGSVDIYNPKVVRSSMGAIFHLPFYQAQSNQEAWELVEALNLQIFMADAQGSLPYTKADLKQPAAILMGSEAHGIEDFLQKPSVQSISLPMSCHSESLNVSVAAGIILYEIQRQRTLA
ncbi:MAG: RNA methyltransferase [Clostridiales bacterium]